MPVDIHSIRLLVADESRRGVTSFNTGMNKVGRSARRATGSVDRMTQSTFRLGGALQALTAALSVRQLVRYADTWKRVTNQLRVVEKDTTAVARAQEKVFQISQNTRQSLEGTTALYTRMKRAQDTLKVSNEDLETVVTAVNKGVAASGATTKEAEAGIIQLSQAFMSGKLAGDELRSVMENIPIIAKAMAEGLGIPFEEFRDQAKDLKPAQLVQGLLNSASDLEHAFGRTAITIEQSFQMLENAVVKAFGQIDEQLKISDQFAEILGKIGRNMDKVVQGIGALGGAFAVLATSAGFKAIFSLMSLLTMGGKGFFGAISRLANLGLVGAGGYAGYQAATPYDPNNPGWLDAPVRQGTWTRETGILSPEGAGGARIRRIPKDWSQLQPNEGKYDVTRRDYLKAFVRKLKDVPDLLMRMLQDSVKIMGAVITALATLLKEQFLIVFSNLREQVSQFIDFSSTATGGFLDWMNRQWDELISASKAGKAPNMLPLYKTPPDAISGRDEVDPVYRAKVLHALYLKSLRDAETKAVNSIKDAASGVWGEFKAFGDDLGILADELARKRQAGIPTPPGVTAEDEKGFDFEGLFGEAHKGLNLIGTALEGVNPTFDKVVTGVNETVTAFATGGPLLGLAVGLNNLMHIFGVVESESERLARQQREMVEALTESAYASERAARSIENFARSLTGLSKSELEAEADFGKTIRAISGLISVTGDTLGDLFGDDLGIAKFYERQEAAREALSRNVGMGGTAGGLLYSPFGGETVGSRRADFFAAFETEEEFLEAIGRRRARFDDLSTASGWDAAVRNVRDAERALANFGEFIDGSFEGALESFQHEKSVQRPIAGALERLFTTTFENFASFDFATGRFAAREIADLSQREINRLEELFVNTRLEAAKEGAAKLIAGYRSIQEMETAERFQADIVRARSTLATQFGRAGSDVNLQRSAISEFNATLKSIRDSITLARGRATAEVSAGGGGSRAGKTTGGGSGSSPSSRAFEDAIAGGVSVDLSGGDRVDVVRHSLDEFSEIFEGAVMDGTARMTIDLSGDVINIIKKRLIDLGEILRIGHSAILDLDLSASGYMGGGRVNITKYSIDALDEVFKGPVMTQTAGFLLDLTANDRVEIKRYGLDSLADVFTGKAMWQTATFTLDMTANDRVTIKRRMIDKLDEVFNFNWNPHEKVSIPMATTTAIDRRSITTIDQIMRFDFVAPASIPIAGNVLIDRQKITSLDQVLDLSGLGGINLADLVDIKIGTTDFFFKVADQSDNIRVAIETVFTGIAQDAKATVELSELVDFNSEGLKGVLFQSINDGIADGQIDLATSPQWLSGDTD